MAERTESPTAALWAVRRTLEKLTEAVLELAATARAAPAAAPPGGAVVDPQIRATVAVDGCRR